MKKEQAVGIAAAVIVVVKAIAKPLLVLIMFPIVVTLGVLGVTIKNPK